ncbi:MAG: hypothetical protein EHM48_00295 [Planctomycetaceae bacterium]|nr:MAG: hypothetical protein EHM48_00295 [Planctomycetaceae bacterium]
MTLDEKQLERLAQWLDGQKIDLSDQEMAWSQDFCSDEQDIAGELDVEVPADSLARVRQLMLTAVAQDAAARQAQAIEAAAVQMQAKVARETEPEPQPAKPAAEVAILQPVAAQPQRVLRVNFRRMAFGAAAAAAVMLAVVIGWHVMNTQPPIENIAQGPAILSADEVDFPLTPYVSAEDKVFDRLAREIDSTEQTFNVPLTKSPTYDADAPAVPTVWPDEPGKPPHS